MRGKKDYGSIIADHIAAIINQRGIEHILHFTRVENLPHILRHGILSRATLAHADFAVQTSDAERLDERDDAISVSISCYAPAMFDAKRYRAGNRSWAILILRPELLWRNHCLFFQQGAATNAMKYEQGKRYGGYALERLFEDFPLPADPRISFRSEYGLPSSWPTSSDAEVQVMEPIDPKYILGAWVETSFDEALVRATFDQAGRTDCDTVAQPFLPRLSCKPYYWG